MLSPCSTSNVDQMWTRYYAYVVPMITEHFQSTSVTHTNPLPPKETPKPPPKQKELREKLRAPVMTDINTQKLFRQAVASPSEYDGTKKEFTTWWSNMQLYLLGYASISDEGKIIAVLSCLTKGDAAFWAQAKKEDIIKGSLRKFDEFKAQLEQ